MDVTTIVNGALPPEAFGMVFEPAVLFGVWSLLVVAVVAGLVAVLGMEGRPEESPVRLRILGRCQTSDQRAAA